MVDALAGLAGNVLADLGHRQVWRKWYGGWINIALPALF
jgi:hypothetical protein